MIKTVITRDRFQHNNGVFFLLTTTYQIVYCKKMKKGFQKSLNLLKCDMVRGSTCGKRAIDVQLFVFLSFRLAGILFLIYHDRTVQYCVISVGDVTEVDVYSQ